MECPYIPFTSLDDFSLRLGKKVIQQHIPLTGSLEVTARCNLRCVHCYINMPADDSAELDQELSGIEIKMIIDQIVDEGCLRLLLTGGEPFLRRDFLDIYTYAKRKGLLVTIFTNGTLLTPRTADYLGEWRPSVIEITLYGSSQETYERVTGIPGSYACCMDGINLLLERSLPLKLKSMVLTINKDEITELQAFAESLGVDYRFDTALNQRLDGNSQPAGYRITPEDAARLDISGQNREEEWLRFTEKYAGPPPKPEYLYQCGAGISSFHIDPYGQLSVCMMARIPSYDLRQGSFVEGWREFIPQVTAQKWSRQTACQTCEIYALCNQCPGWSQIESADQQIPVEYLCEVAHHRAQALGIAIRKETQTGELDDAKAENGEILRVTDD